MTVTSLAEYLIYRADKQEDVLHNSRWSQSQITGAYSDASRALRAYNIDPRRSSDILDRAKEALERRALALSTTPKGKDKAMGCKEAIELFERSENAFGIRQLMLIEPPRFNLLLIEGVELSIQPDFLVRAKDAKGEDRNGAGLIRLPKAPDPNSCKLDETRQRRGEHRREMARYMVAMLQMLLEDQPPNSFPVSVAHCFVNDVRLGERIDAATDHASRLRTIRVACKQIARQWDSLTPKPSIQRKAS